MIIANIIGAIAFLVLALIYAFPTDSTTEAYIQNMQRAQMFALMFVGLAIAVAIVAK